MEPGLGLVHSPHPCPFAFFFPILDWDGVLMVVYICYFKSMIVQLRLFTSEQISAFSLNDEIHIP